MKSRYARPKKNKFRNKQGAEIQGLENKDKNRERIEKKYL